MLIFVIFKPIRKISLVELFKGFKFRNLTKEGSDENLL